MRTKNFRSFVLLLIFTLGACTGPQPKAPSEPITGGGTPVTGGQPGSGKEPMGPPSPPQRQMEPPHIALVLGGAGIASFATAGLLKRFAEEGIKIDYIVTTGWPTLFALAQGFFKSAHDVEWFAMRLQEKDFYNAGLFELNRDYESHERLSSLIQSSFKQKDLTEAHTPVIIAATNTDLGEPDIYDRGDWKEPLLKTMSIPGIYRPYPPGGNAESVSSLRGLDVEEAVHRGGKIIVAVDMYGDYFQHLKNSRKDSSDAVFRRLYLGQLTKSLNAQMKQAQLHARITLGKSPSDFAAKRAAILAGYKEGTRLAKELRTQYSSR